MRKAVEVVTLLGDSIVDVTYRCESVPPSRVRGMLAGIGLACLLGSGAAFGVGVATAADNRAAFDKWTGPAKRPAYAFRPTRLSRGLDIAIFAGAAMSVCAFTGMLLCRRRDDESLELAGERLTFDELVALDGRIDAGPAAYIVRPVEAPEIIALASRRSDRRPLFYAAGSFALHGGLLWLMSTPLEADRTEVSIASVEELVVSTDMPLPPSREELQHWHGEETPAEELAVLPTMFLQPTPYVLSNEHVRMPVVQRDPQAERELAIEAARNAGILGAGILQPGFFSSLQGSDFTTGFADTDIYCENCREPEDSLFGFGRSGFGICGGIHGTIGTGRYGTVGWSSRTSSAAPRSTRVAAVPTAALGPPTVSGALERNYIRRYIKRHINKIRYCYEKELLARPTLEGVITVQFFINEKGTVTSSVATGFDKTVATCVADVIRNIQFRYGDGPAQVNYPFTFRPAGP